MNPLTSPSSIRRGIPVPRAQEAQLQRGSVHMKTGYSLLSVRRSLLTRPLPSTFRPVVPQTWSPMNRSHSSPHTVAFRFASVPYALFGFLLSALSVVLLAVIGLFTITQVQPKQTIIWGQAGPHSRPPSESTCPASSTSPPDSDARPVANSACPPLRVDNPPIVTLPTASLGTSCPRQVRTPHALPKGGILQSARTPCLKAKPGELRSPVNSTIKHENQKQPWKCVAVTEGQEARRGVDSQSAAKLRSASMPHLPQVKRSPKFTLSTSGDKATGKQPTKVPRAIPPAAPHYVALPGLSPAGTPTDQGRKANTTSGVKFEQYHMWSRKAKSLRNLKATQADALVYLSGSTNTFPRSMSSPPRKQRLLDTPTRPSISSVLLSAHTKEGTAVGDMLRIRRRSIPGDALLERPSSAESSSEGSLHLGILYARSMSTTALPELVKRQPETTSKRSPPWLARFRRRAPSAAGSTSEHWQSNA